VAASTTPAAPAPQAAQGHKRVQSNAEETVPKCSKTTDTAEDNPNSDNDEGGNDQQAAPKKAPAKGKGKTPAKGKKIRCMAWPYPPFHLLTTPPTTL